LQHLGPALASSISSWINIAVLAVILHRRGLMQWDARLKRAVPLMGAAGLAMAAAVGMARETIYAPMAGGSLTRLLGLCAVIAIGLAVYGLAGQMIGAFNVKAMLPARWQ